MQARWRLLLEKFSAFSTRERLLVLAALFAVSYQLADLALFDRQYQSAEKLNAEMTRDRATMRSLTQEVNALAQQARQDPNRRLKDDISRLRGQIETVRDELQAATRGLISPQDMSRFLEQLLVQEQDLELLRLSTLDTRPMVDPESAAVSAGSKTQAAAMPVLHRHGFVIEFRGSYLATLRYLETLERLPWDFFWDSVDYEVTAYPQAIVRLQLHTLSLSEDWIGV